MINVSALYGVNELDEVLLTPDDHVRAFTTPAAGDGITRRLELEAMPDSHATATLPGESGWGYSDDEADDPNDKLIDINRCDEFIADPTGNPNEILPLAYHGTASGTTGYNFVTFIDDGIITFCDDDEDGDVDENGNNNEDGVHEFTLLITDEDTVHIKPNPANIRVSTDEDDFWIKLKALRYEHGDPENTDVPVTVDWKHVDDVVFAKSEEGDVRGDVMNVTQVNDYESENIWAKSSVAGEYTIKADTVPGSSEESSEEIEGVLNVINADLDAMKVDHNVANGELPETDETNPGAFVPINNDDDDYDASNTADKEQSGSITGESDLLPIKLHKVDPAVTGSKYRLDIPTQVKIWQNSDRSEAVTTTTEFDANEDTTLYVEGVTVGSGNLKINWINGDTTLDDCDEIKVTVFNWDGPLNVPDYSIHQYTASGALGTSKWVTPGSGTIKTGENSSDVTILWGEGPIVGKAIYQVNDDYVWDLEVNVVQVKIKQGNTNKITYGNPPVQLGNVGNLRQIIKASGGAKAMIAELTVEKLEGPVVNGNRRGVKFIEMGFSQDVMNTRIWGNFDGFTPKLKRQISVSNNTRYLDGDPDGTVPWYDPDGKTLTIGARGFFSQPNSDATVNNTNFKIGDTPRLPGTDDMELTIPPYLPQKVSSFEIEADFNLYFAVRTTDTRNDADKVYTQRGSAHWEFDGSGDINTSGIWTKTGSGNTGSADFTEVTSGDVVPTITLPWMNDAGAAATWSTEPQ